MAGAEEEEGRLSPHPSPPLPSPSHGWLAGGSSFGGGEEASAPCGFLTLAAVQLPSGRSQDSECVQRGRRSSGVREKVQDAGLFMRLLSCVFILALRRCASPKINGRGKEKICTHNQVTLKQSVPLSKGLEEDFHFQIHARKTSLS